MRRNISHLVKKYTYYNIFDEIWVTDLEVVKYAGYILVYKFI